MFTLEKLLSKRWISIEKDRELFYQIRDDYREYEDFLKDKLGFSIVFTGKFIKLDKFGVPAESWMGIKDFKSKLSYVFLCLILAFLENLDEEEQFILSELSEFITLTFKGEEIDWINRSDRVALVDALKFCVDEGIIKKNDGNEENYTSDNTVQVLYENTGLSKYFMRVFNQNINEIDSMDSFESSATTSTNGEVFLRHQVYRKLLMTLGVFNTPENEEEFKYIKRYRESIQENLSKYFDINLHVHKNAAFLVVGDNSTLGKCYPDNSASSKISIQCNISLLLNSYIRKGIETKKFEIDYKDNIILKKDEFKNIVKEARNKYNIAFTKDYRTMGDEKFIEAAVEYYKNMGIMIEENDRYIFNSIVGKVIGEYNDKLLVEENHE